MQRTNPQGARTRSKKKKKSLSSVPVISGAHTSGVHTHRTVLLGGVV